MIRFDDVVARYRGMNRDALGGVSFEAARGRLTAVVGPNGSGKSTLVRVLVGRLPLARGQVLVDAADAAKGDRRSLARRVAVVPQREEQLLGTRVRDYIALGRFPHLGDWGAMGAADREAVELAVRRTGVAEFMDRASDALSGGEWQRVRLARALAQQGEALVLDEPTTFLDIGHEMAVFELLHRLADEGQAVLLVSHQLNLVARFADQMVLLHQGMIAASGAPDVVMQAGILERVYEWPLVVTRDPAVGAPALLPLRRRSAPR